MIEDVFDLGGVDVYENYDYLPPSPELFRDLEVVLEEADA